MNREHLSSEAGVTTPRALGRVILASLLALAVALIVLPLGLSFAQGTPEIELVNPNETSSNVVSDFERPYEPTAWLTSLPVQPRVEFLIKDADGAIVVDAVAGTATADSTNVFEADLDIPDNFVDGAYVLNAVLYQNYTGPGTGTVLDTATQDITVNAKLNQMPPLPPEGPSATPVINYPENGSDLGVNVTATETSFLIEGDVSTGTETVTGYYSTSPYGTDPIFVACASDPAVPDAMTFTLRCVLEAEAFGLDVTAVAVTADRPGTPLPIDDIVGAADGHAVHPYYQRPTTLTLDSDTQSNVPTGGCAKFVATVVDQLGRPIAGTNVDVHAQGPAENLAFDVGALYGDDNQPPDMAHGSTDKGWECPANGTGGVAGDAATEGTHVVSGSPSRKHIESLEVATADFPAGTDEEGTLVFGLYSATVGATQLTAWADFDGDDLLCADEAKDSASIGWGAPAPGISPETPEVASGQCQVGEPTPSASASASASPTESASPSVSPSTSPTPEPTTWDRDITIGFKHLQGKKMRIKGKVTVETGGPSGCIDGVPVQIAKRKDGAWKILKTVQTGSTGKYKAKVRDKKGKYRALASQVFAGADDICAQTSAAKKHTH